MQLQAQRATDHRRSPRTARLLLTMLPQALAQLLGVVAAAAGQGRREGWVASNLPSSGRALRASPSAARRFPRLQGSPGQRADCAGGRQGEQEGKVEAGHRERRCWGLARGLGGAHGVNVA